MVWDQPSPLKSSKKDKTLNIWGVMESEYNPLANTPNRAEKGRDEFGEML